MNDYQKEYIECRLILLGNEKVGKKSFINRILNVPSTSVIRNFDLENNYRKKILKLRKKYDKKKKYLEMLQKMDEEIAKPDMKNTIKDEKAKTLLPNNINLKSLSKSPDKKFMKIENNENYIMQITREELFFSKDYERPPIPEHPSKLFNIHKTKICVKPFFILPAEKINNDYVQTEDESENDLDNEIYVSFKGIKKDIKTIINDKKTIIEEDKLYGYKISIYNIFLFMYDMNDFNSFQILMHYYDLIESSIKISNIDNVITCIIGNKKDQKKFFYSEQQNTFNDFIKENNLQFFEISTKPFYNFDKFFIEFLLNILNKYHENLVNEYNFKEDFEKIVFNKPNFSKSLRELFQNKDSSPGPNYDVNIYSFNSAKEINETLNNNKLRFNKKIFYNKIGPKYIGSKSTKDINCLDNNSFKIKNNVYLSLAMGGIVNRQIEGYTFGTLKGKLNLLKDRKKLILERNESLKESIERDYSFLFNKNLNTSRIRGEEYLEEASQRRNKLFEQKIFERKKILEKLSEIHSNNLSRLKDEEIKKKKKIILSQNNKSLSTPDLLSTNTTFISNKIDSKETNKKRFLESVFPKNKDNLKRYSKILKKIHSNKKEDITPAPNAYDIRNNYTDCNKGPTITGKRKEIVLSKMDPSFPDLKDEFDIIIEKSKKKYQIKEFKPRFKRIQKEENNGPYPNEKIWKKWKENKLNNEKEGRIKDFLQYVKFKKKRQLKKMEEIKEQKEEILNLRKEILIRKGYEDQNGAKSINYSLIEDSSPKFTIKGRYSSGLFEGDKYNLKDIFHGNSEMMELVKNSQLNRPLPNTNIIKPRFPTVIFNKAQRFNKDKEYIGSLDLFQDGNFGIKTQENFSSQEPFSHISNRDSIYPKAKGSPSPGDYKIKSSFEVIAEKGKKISEIRDKLRKKYDLKNIEINGVQNEVNFDLPKNEDIQNINNDN